jgi:hypothetical protein
VDDQTERFTRWKPDSPAAAWYFLFFFTKILYDVQNFVKKNDFFRPAGGEISFWVSNRVSPVSY